MTLYHGSNVGISEPKLILSRTNLDFGSGFYTTSDLKQAKNWAMLKSKRLKEGKATVSFYEVEESQFHKLKIKVFSSPDSEWLHFVADNRTGNYKGISYDLVIGPIANDVTMFAITGYISGTIDEKTTLLILKPQKLKDQYAFLSDKSLSLLSYIKELKV